MKYGETRFSPNKFWKLYINSTCIWHILPIRNFKSLKGTYLYMTYLVPPSSISIINQFIHINENSLGGSWVKSYAPSPPLWAESQTCSLSWTLHEHYMNMWKYFWITSHETNLTEHFKAAVLVTPLTIFITHLSFRLFFPRADLTLNSAF